MRTTLGLLLVVSLSLLALPAAAQDDGGDVGLIYCLDVQPAQQVRFEAAFKEHLNWHRKQKDTWSWTAWNVTTGPNTGQYCSGSFGHKWEDFDNPSVSPQDDHADAQATLFPHTSAVQVSYWVDLPKVSRPADEPAPMSSVIFFHVEFGMDAEFKYLIGEFHKAIEKTEMPWRYQWVALASGGDGGSYVLVQPRANFASFNPTGKPFDEMLEEAYGRKGADALLARWRDVVKGSENQLTQGRPDLSYTPEP